MSKPRKYHTTDGEKTLNSAGAQSYYQQSKTNLHGIWFVSYQTWRYNVWYCKYYVFCLHPAWVPVCFSYSKLVIVLPNMLSVTEPTDRLHGVRVGVGNSSWQLDSITPTRESFVRDSFKVGFSTLYFPSTWAQTLPKHLLQQSHYDPKGLGHKLLKFEDAARPTTHYFNNRLLCKLNSAPFWPAITQSKT